MSDFECIDYRVEGQVAYVTFNRPRVLNAFNEQQREETRRAFRAVQQDPGIRCAVMSGAGDRAFSAGQDINESNSFGEGQVAAWIDSWEDLYGVIRETEVPVVASIRGYAVGAGLQVALCADVRVASEDSQFGMTEINIGIPCITGTATMWGLLSLTLIKDLVLTGRLLSGEDALLHGMVSRLYANERLGAETRTLAEELAGKSQTAVRMNKEWWNALTGPIMEQAREFAKQAHARAYRSGEATSKMSAFLRGSRQ
jgi:enoyl-CoA hydratase/carnithine racemase